MAIWSDGTEVEEMLCEECRNTTTRCDRCSTVIPMPEPDPEGTVYIRKGVGWEYGIALFMFGLLMGMGLVILGKLI